MYEVKVTSKTSIFFCELGKTWQHNLRLCSKDPLFHLFHELEKFKKSLETRSKILKSLFGFKKSRKCNQRPTVKNSNFEVMDELGKVMPYLSFTVEK